MDSNTKRHKVDIEFSFSLFVKDTIECAKNAYDVLFFFNIFIVMVGVKNSIFN